jgi:hypothetical protein
VDKASSRELERVVWWANKDTYVAYQRIRRIIVNHIIWL